jgi:hypothetical protein
MMAVLAIAASITEFVSRLMHVGSWNAANWLSKDFQLEDWGGQNANTSPNGIGFKALEIEYQVTQGMVLWVDG